MLYEKHIKTDSGTYSIDKLIVEIWMGNGVVTKEYLVSLFELYGWKYYKLQWEKKKIETAMWLTHRFRFWEGTSDTSVVLELLERKVNETLRFPQSDEDGNWTGETTVVKKFLGYEYGVRIQFNPNKHFNHIIVKKFFEWYRILTEQVVLKFGDGRAPQWRWRRVDFAFDVPDSMDNLVLLSRKEEAYQYTTRYYGKRGKNGHTRVYDKQLEYNRHSFHLDKIKEPLTRIEWEQHNEQPVTFDKPLTLGDLPPRCQWLRYIKLGELNHCLDTLDKRTKKKIKDNCFKEIAFDPGIFDTLLREYQEAFGLLDERHFVTFGEFNKMTADEKTEWIETMAADWGRTRSEMWEKLDSIGVVPGVDDLEREFYNNSPIKIVGTDTSHGGASVIDEKE